MRRIHCPQMLARMVQLLSQDHLLSLVQTQQLLSPLQPQEQLLPPLQTQECPYQRAGSLIFPYHRLLLHSLHFPSFPPFPNPAFLRLCWPDCWHWQDSPWSIANNFRRTLLDQSNYKYRIIPILFQSSNSQVDTVIPVNHDATRFRRMFGNMRWNALWASTLRTAGLPQRGFRHG